jgi:hypothetical protein
MIAVYRLEPHVPGPKGHGLEVVRRGDVRYVPQPLGDGYDQLPEDGAIGFLINTHTQEREDA